MPIYCTTTTVIITTSSEIQFYKIDRSDERIRRRLICKVTFLENEASHAVKLFNHFDPFWIIASPATLFVPRITSYIYIYMRCLTCSQACFESVTRFIWIEESHCLSVRMIDGIGILRVCFGAERLVLMVQAWLPWINKIVPLHWLWFLFGARSFRRVRSMTGHHEKKVICNFQLFE